MRQFLKYMIAFGLLLTYYNSAAISKSHDPIGAVLAELNSECLQIRNKYGALNRNLEALLSLRHFDLKKSKNTAERVNLLIKKDSLNTILKENNAMELTELSKIRYLKGLQIIKILYEKIVSLDHHFASVSTFREINKISNPNNYAEFTSVKEMLKSKKNKKTGFDLTEILGSNIYTSVVHSVVSLFTNENASKKEKDESIREIECILDFTLRMHNDLNTIYFETVFLQKSNENIMKDLQQLFVDYTKPIKYTRALKDCRNSDDWDSVRSNLSLYLEELELIIKTKGQSSKAHRMQINLHFPIDRLLQFITQYNAFIDQGGKFYEKFDIMLNSYENEQRCAGKIPIAYKTLKEGISVAVEKFNNAYKPIEINGSKMKEILYGINEYE